MESNFKDVIETEGQGVCGGSQSNRSPVPFLTRTFMAAGISIKST